MFKDLILKNRSYRRFHQSTSIEPETLRELVDLARLSPSAANLQPLKYILSCDPETNAKIFSTVTFAAALKDWAGPAEGERPTAYIIVLGDEQLAHDFGALGFPTMAVVTPEGRLDSLHVGLVEYETLESLVARLVSALPAEGKRHR